MMWNSRNDQIKPPCSSIDCTITNERDEVKRNNDEKEIEPSKKKMVNNRAFLRWYNETSTSLHVCAMKNFSFGKSSKCDKEKLPAIFIITTYDGWHSLRAYKVWLTKYTCSWLNLVRFGWAVRFCAFYILCCMTMIHFWVCFVDAPLPKLQRDFECALFHSLNEWVFSRKRMSEAAEICVLAKHTLRHAIKGVKRNCISGTQNKQQHTRTSSVFIMAHTEWERGIQNIRFHFLYSKRC